LATAYFGYSVSLLARIADVLGESEDAHAYRGLFDRICTAFMKAYVSPDGRIKGDTQTVYVLAVYFDLLDPEIRMQALKRLLQVIVGKGFCVRTRLFCVG